MLTTINDAMLDSLGLGSSVSSMENGDCNVLQSRMSMKLSPRVQSVSIASIIRHCQSRCPSAQRSRPLGTSGPFQSTHSLRSATAPDLIHCYSTEQIILCANLPKKTVIARLLFLSIYLSIFYSQCITPIADLPGNSCELEVGAQAMFNSL